MSESEPQHPHEPQHSHEPHIQILKGRPTDQEVAALVAVLGSVGGPPPPPPPEPARWGLPVDKLRYPVFSWQRITLQEMTHMRR
ncbi:hypothetical protein BST12_01260 [Mycobacterium angelicum]|uniref:Acyl-CoA carboxylase subunit epsilon n=1 Tax=Mycobacterium angelicum TaxID=470074 RepID=A0A1X0A8Y1_MYCAN|nr:acyl-CoA carboxylase subunit epsilon [Mycobacterium angelicum]ORA26527.1 hypothetical protein BST12_01260 [Mycobacterium angelicum]